MFVAPICAKARVSARSCRSHFSSIAVIKWHNRSSGCVLHRFRPRVALPVLILCFGSKAGSMPLVESLDRLGDGKVAQLIEPSQKDFAHHGKLPTPYVRRAAVDHVSGYGDCGADLANWSEGGDYAASVLKHAGSAFVVRSRRRPLFCSKGRTIRSLRWSMPMQIR